ncbi:MAG: trimethylamine methyltransferase family protein [Chloroflexi bacterium]|nr:trimethylamine methyltransferase family protein [Chloroflexota bacterium]
MSPERRSRRRSRRSRGEVPAPVAKITQPLHQLPVYELLDAPALERIHQAALEILSEVGILFMDDAEALTILQEHGVRVEGELAFFSPVVIEEYVGKAPSQFTQRARNPERSVQIGGKAMCFAPVYGPPFVADREHGRRNGTLQDFQDFVKLAYLSPYIHHSGGVIVEPNDRPTATRHLDMLYSHIKYSDKPFMGSVISAEDAADSVKMVEMLFGAEEIRQQPALISLINISSPRRLDDRMLAALKVYARARQAVIITPFILSGAMAPAAVAGTLAQQHAEALAGIAFTQMVEPGTPVVYGSFQTNVDLQSGSPVFGSPESQLALYVSAQLARRQNLPFRSGGMFASAKIPDIQAGYESVMTMLPAVMARVNFVLHAAGWLDGGLTAGFEKFVLDCEILGAFHTFLKGLDMSENGFAMESIRSVPPGGHHLGTPHTMKNFRTAFYRSELFDYQPSEAWEAAGAVDAYERAAAEVKRRLRSYEAPPLDPNLDAELQAFIRARKAELMA